MPTLSRAPQREYKTGLMDSHRWEGFKPRADDIVIATFGKAGTTWMQRIVDLLIFQSPDPRPIMDTAPWLDAAFLAPVEAYLATLEAQAHRRTVKTHLPFDSLPVWHEVKYIHVVRDGRDAALSMHNHMLGMKPEFRPRFPDTAGADANAAAGLEDAPADPRDFFVQWLERAQADGTGGTDLGYFEFENTYWRERARQNLLFVHYNDLKSDLAGEMRRVADHLGIAVSQSRFPELVQAATFDAMKRDGDALMPLAAMVFDHGSQRFLHKGTNERWRNVLTKEDVFRYEALAARKWTANQAAYIEHGRLATADPREK